MPYGTFNWNYAILIGEDENNRYWHDPVNGTYHITQKDKK